MIYNELRLIELLAEAESGCHTDLCCYVAIKDKLNAIRDQVGPEGLEMVIRRACLSCSVASSPTTPTSVTPAVTTRPVPPTVKPGPTVLNPLDCPAFPVPENYSDPNAAKGV